MNVVVTGTLGFDYIMNFSGRFADRIMPEKIHKLSLSFLVDTLNKQFGGTAGNVAYSLKLLGVEPTIVAPAGNDFAPYKKFLQSKKISTKGIAIHQDVATSAYFVMTDKEDNQIGSFYLGATKYAKDLSISAITDSGNPKDSRNQSQFAVLGPTDPPAMKKYVTECRSFTLPYLYDPAFQIANFSSYELREGIEGAQILIGNDYEIALIEERLDISHEELVLMVPVLVTTIGKKGSIIETRHDAIHVKPAKPKNESDPTGAGDAYRAGFLAGYLRARFPESVIAEDELLVCGQIGSVSAVYTVETYGTQTHMFTKNEFIKRYRENYGTTIVL